MTAALLHNILDRKVQKCFNATFFMLLVVLGEGFRKALVAAMSVLMILEGVDSFGIDHILW